MQSIFPNAVMQWIGGPSKDLGEKEGSGKFAAVGSTGASKLESGGSNAALRGANKKGGGGDETTDEKLDKIIDTLDGGGGGQDQSVGESAPRVSRD